MSQWDIIDYVKSRKGWVTQTEIVKHFKETSPNSISTCLRRIRRAGTLHYTSTMLPQGGRDTHKYKAKTLY